MGKQTGNSKTGGRQKGTPNKKTLILNEIFESKNFCIANKLIEILPLLQPEKQADVLLDLMSYIYPKRKAIEQTSLTANLHAHVTDLENLNHQDLTDLHRATTQKLLGYDFADPEARRMRMEQLISMHNNSSGSKSITLKPKR